MSNKIRFALNHITTPKLDTPAFLQLAASLGCAGVELRNDLADKKLADRPFFDGQSPADIGKIANASGLRLLGLSEVYGFNNWSGEMESRVRILVEQARESGAESISLIPLNDGSGSNSSERQAKLRFALSNVKSMLAGTAIIALVEPLGFTSSTLRHKAEAIEAIEAVGGLNCFKLVHDTFHHHLAGETEFFPDQTGIVHISGVVDPGLELDAMQDAHRILVDRHDRLGNIDQIRSLIAAGYKGAFSFEPFSAVVHASPDIATDLKASMDFIRNTVL
jgi:2-keto-myo-inositol isomerase